MFGLRSPVHRPANPPPVLGGRCSVVGGRSSAHCPADPPPVCLSVRRADRHVPPRHSRNQVPVASLGARASWERGHPDPLSRDPFLHRIKSIYRILTPRIYPTGNLQTSARGCAPMGAVEHSSRRPCHRPCAQRKAHEQVRVATGLVRLVRTEICCSEEKPKLPGVHDLVVLGHRMVAPARAFASAWHYHFGSVVVAYGCPQSLPDVGPGQSRPIAPP